MIQDIRFQTKERERETSMLNQAYGPLATPRLEKVRTRFLVIALKFLQENYIFHVHFLIL